MFISHCLGTPCPIILHNSILIDSSLSQYLSRTFGTPTNPYKFTFSTWVKRAKLGAAQGIISARYGTTQNYAHFAFTASDNLILYAQDTAAVVKLNYITNAVFRDPSALLHVMFTWDATLATPEFKIYVNGTLQTLSTSTNAIVQNSAYGMGSQNTHYIGTLISDTGALGSYFDGLDSDTFFIDGQIVSPSSFGYTCPRTGQWLPKPYTGSYGTNGFHLKFENAGALGEDSSGNGNNWTLNGGIVAANQLTDVPGKNFCTLNPIIAGATGITKGNLTSSTTAVRGTFDCSLFDSYWEVEAGASAVTAGTITEGGTAHTTTVTANKIFAFELSTAGTLRYRNVTDSGSWTDITTGLSGSRFPYGVAAAANWNFGQRTFVGTPEGGFKALNTQNLSLGNTVTTSGTFTGNASADGPFVWMNGAPETLTINGNAVTWGTHADKTAGGFKLRTSSSSYNASGSNTWTATVLSPAYKSLFKYQNAKSN